MISAALFILLGLPASALAITDSYKEFPSKLQHWKITAVHMDTGEIRSCMAAGTFDRLKVRIGSPFGGALSEITFEFTREDVPTHVIHTDERACGNGKSDAPKGTWRRSHAISSNQICDGSQWRTLKAGPFANASLLSNGKEIAKSVESSNYEIDLNAEEPFVYRYQAWFHDVPALEEKLLSAGKVTLRFEVPKLKPIELGDLELGKVVTELRKCAR